MKKSLYFENLDGLRFICFLLVFFYHSFYTKLESIKSTHIYHFIKDFLFRNGDIGVNFFFVLSGFLITYLLIQEKISTGKLHLKHFYLRRILRIWPLFFLCVFIGFYLFPIILSLSGRTSNETATLGYYLVFLNNFNFIQNGAPEASILGVLWSVAVEEQFYLIWPIILYFLPLKKYWIAFVSVIIISLSFRAYYNSDLLNGLHTISCIGDMAVGAFGAWLVLQKTSFKQFVEGLNKWAIWMIYALFALCYFFKTELFHDMFVMRVFERIILAVIILFIILEQNYAKNSFFKMSRWKTLTQLGTISYGLYCLHFAAIALTLAITRALDVYTELWQVIILETSLALVLSIVMSSLSYRYFERPFLKLKERFSHLKD